jgi:hypothetical protein
LLVAVRGAGVLLPNNLLNTYNLFLP